MSAMSQVLSMVEAGPVKYISVGGSASSKGRMYVTACTGGKNFTHAVGKDVEDAAAKLLTALRMKPEPEPELPMLPGGDDGPQLP